MDLVRTSTRKTGSRREDDVKMDLKEYDGGVDWVLLAQDGDQSRTRVDMVIYFQFP
jgi:hypothetical protein